MRRMPTLAAWLHDWDPFALRIGGGFGIRWYGLAYVTGFVVAWWLLVGLARRGRVLLSPEAVGDAIVWLVGGVLVGGRLGYVLVYRPSLLVDFSADFPWWGVLSINQGGMASHGGIVGVVVACWILARRHRVPMLHLADCVALVGPIGLGLGRLANFVNGELLGKVVAGPGERAPWWSVRFPQEIVERPAELPEAQLRALDALFVDVAARYGVPIEEVPGWIVAKVQAGNADVAAAIEPLLSARHPSQLYQAMAEGAIVLAVLWWVWRRPRKPGVVGCWFLIVYGIGRVVTEFVRLPDAHLVTQRPLGLSRGQWLSAGMAVLGVVLLAWVARRDVPRVGGWLGAADESTSAGSSPAPASEDT